MKQGKQICDRLKAIRSEIAQANEIDYTPIECDHQGDCDGTCPACEKETRWLERQLRLRQASVWPWHRCRPAACRERR